MDEAKVSEDADTRPDPKAEEEDAGDVLNPTNRHEYSYSVANLLRINDARKPSGSVNEARRSQQWGRADQAAPDNISVSDVDILPYPGSGETYLARRQLIELLRAEEIAEGTAVEGKAVVLSDDGNGDTTDGAAEHDAFPSKNAEPEPDAPSPPTPERDGASSEVPGKEHSPSTAAAALQRPGLDSGRCSRESPFHSTHFDVRGYYGEVPLLGGAWEISAHSPEAEADMVDSKAGEDKEASHERNKGSDDGVARVAFLKTPPPVQAERKAAAAEPKGGPESKESRAAKGVPYGEHNAGTGTRGTDSKGP